MSSYEKGHVEIEEDDDDGDTSTVFLVKFRISRGVGYLVTGFSRTLNRTGRKLEEESLSLVSFSVSNLYFRLSIDILFRHIRLRL